jgi:hypothetical protein
VRRAIRTRRTGVSGIARLGAWMRTETTEHAQSNGCRSCGAASTTSMPPSSTSWPSASNSPNASASSKPTTVCPRPTSPGSQAGRPAARTRRGVPPRPGVRGEVPRVHRRRGHPPARAHRGVTRELSRERLRQSPPPRVNERWLTIGRSSTRTRADGFADAVHSRLELIVGARDAPRLVIPLNGMSAGRVLRQPRDNRRSFVFNRKRVRPWSMPSSAPEATRKR